MRTRWIKVFALCLLILGERKAHAYTDPGSGTLLLQILLAASFGIMFYIRRIIAWTRGLFNRNSEPALQANDDGSDVES